MIDVGAIRQKHIGNGASVPVLAVGLERDFLAKDQVRCSLLRFLAIGLAFLRAVDAAEADAFRVVVVQDFDGVAVEDAGGLSQEIAGRRMWGKKEPDNNGNTCYSDEG